jgi:RNA polymerase sigma-70 factor, ECF subfamily
VSAGTALDRTADRGLAERVAQGDRGAQRELFLTYRRAVHHVLFRVLGSNHEIEDVVQDAFVQIFRSIGGYRGESTLSRWCCTVATRTAFAAIDRQRRTPRGEGEAAELERGGPGMEEALGHRLAARRLYQALEKIDDKHRVAFALAVIDERPLSEVAELTDSTVSAVKTRVFRARRELLRRAAKDSLLSAYLTELDDEEVGP